MPCAQASGFSCILVLRLEELKGSGGVGGCESRGIGGVEGKGGVGGEGSSDSCFRDSCWLGEVDEVREVVELLGSWSNKVGV